MHLKTDVSELFHLHRRVDIHLITNISELFHIHRRVDIHLITDVSEHCSTLIGDWIST
jgi:hypothetical protein